MKNAKKYKSTIWGVLLLMLSVTAYGILTMQDEDAEEIAEESSVPKIPVKTISPSEQSIEIPVLGKVQAQKKFDVYTEVNGILEKGNRQLLPATSFRKGEAIAHINSRQFEAELKALKSAFKAKITAVMAVVKFDFPKNYQNWLDYLNHISPKKSLGDLPAYKSSKESMYFISKGIEQQYYQIKSQEELLKKYTIIAPFDGLLSTVDMKQGAMVSAGQRLGTFIGKENFDIVTDIKKEQIAWVSIGDTLQLENGKAAIVKRIDNTIDVKSQTIKIYASISDHSLKHDDFISGTLKSSQKVEGCIIDRKLIADDNTIFISVNEVVRKIPIHHLLSNRGKSLITGIKKPVSLLTKTSGIKSGQSILSIQIQ